MPGMSPLRSVLDIPLLLRPDHAPTSISVSAAGSGEEAKDLTPPLNSLLETMPKEPPFASSIPPSIFRHTSRLSHWLFLLSPLPPSLPAAASPPSMNPHISSTLHRLDPNPPSDTIPQPRNGRIHSTNRTNSLPTTSNTYPNHPLPHRSSDKSWTLLVKAVCLQRRSEQPN